MDAMVASVQVYLVANLLKCIRFFIMVMVTFDAVPVLYL